MAANQPQWPREWLMTDEHMGERLWDGLAALPRGSGVVFRHYGLARDERLALGERIAKVCHDRGLMLAVAGDVRLARQLGAALVHNPVGDPGDLPFSRSAHSGEEAKSHCASGASLIFVSPIYPTASHPGRQPLAREIARRIVASCAVPVIALGGMSRSRFDERKRDGYYGWAAIDAWLGEIRT